MNKLLACTGFAVALATAGCTLYFGEEEDDGVQVSHYCDGTADATTCYTCYTEPNGYQECFPDGYGCSADSGCAAGCYCDESSGACVEAGYCASDAECGFGLTCDCSGSCVPDNTETRTCSPDSCWTSGCPEDSVCTAEGICVIDQPLPPTACESDGDCAAGCYCVDGLCEETSVCAGDGDCADGEVCDTDRSTCVPEPPPPPPPPPACGDYTTQAACEAQSQCRAVVGGTNCHRPDGSTCQSGDTSCTCEPPFTFQGCVPRL